MKTIATWRTFDLFHDGHREFLQKAKALGDRLVVVVVPDTVVYKNKRRYPLHNQETRAENVRRFSCVDEVYIDSFGEGLSSLLSSKPDLFVFGKGQDQKWRKKLKEYLRSRGIEPTYQFIRTASKTHTTTLRESLEKSPPETNSK